MNSYCSQCKEALPGEEQINCISCKSSFHYICENISETNFKKLGSKKKSWKCTECKTKNAFLANEMKKISGQLTEANNKLEDFEKALSFNNKLTEEYAKQIASLEEKLVVLEKKEDNVMNELNWLTAAVEESYTTHIVQQQATLATSVEIIGIPEEQTDVVLTLHTIASSVKCDLNAEDIVNVSREKTKIPDRPGAIIAEFVSASKRDELLARVKENKGVKIPNKNGGCIEGVFVNELLTSKNKQILCAAKKFKADNHYEFLWVRDGKIYMRKNRFTEAVYISTIAKLKSMANATANVTEFESDKFLRQKQMITETNARKSPHTSTEPRYIPHEIPNNGLVLNEVYLPDEILTQILSYVRVKDLLNSCLYVCHKWKELIQHEVWKLKAEREYLHKPIDDKPSKPTRLPDLVYQGICCNVGYNRNLLENNSGQLRLEKWNILENGGDGWQIESPAAGVPRPENATYEEPKHCFVTSYEDSKKRQMIILTNKGIHPSILDEFQPEIVVSEWYAARNDCPAYYSLEVHLLDANLEEIAKYVDDIHMKDELHINGWHVMSHTFKNYGPGVRYISFTHTGRDLNWWGGHYGSKMANAQVVVNIPIM